MYLVCEGVDGCGKDSQADMLISRMVQNGLGVQRVAEPCEDLPHGQLLRRLLASGDFRQSHAALFLADRMALQETKVKPALDAGRHVVSVRSFLSTLVYQQENWPLDWLIAIHQQMIVRPDVVVWIDVDPEVGLERVGKRAQAKEVYEKLDIQRRNRERYRNLLSVDGSHHGRALELLDQNATVIIVDGSKSREEVHEHIWEAIRRWAGWATLLSEHDSIPILDTSTITWTQK